ncbi:hypothetical protein NHP190002_09850 [Helicobacter ailurogastricus]|nr:hypothetical protein NHP190002_09850 [Helicobacter ailurogastricus]
MFFHDLATTKGFVGEKSTFSELSEDYKGRIKILSKEQLGEFLQEIHRYVPILPSLAPQLRGGTWL